LIQETTEKIRKIQERIKVAQNRQKAILMKGGDH